VPYNDNRRSSGQNNRRNREGDLEKTPYGGEKQQQQEEEEERQCHDMRRTADTTINETAGDMEKGYCPTTIHEVD
jgi:hypothetical protein